MIATNHSTYWLMNLKKESYSGWWQTLFTGDKIFDQKSSELFWKVIFSALLILKKWSSHFIVINNAGRDSTTVLYKSTKQRQYEAASGTDTVTDRPICESISASLYQDH